MVPLDNGIGSCLAAVDARVVGQISGAITVATLLLFGAVRCYSISRRPTTNTKCALSLMFLLLAWCLAAVTPHGEQFASRSAVLASVLFLTGLGMAGMVVASVVLAILGLRELRRQPGVYVQGRAQAIWALVISSLLLMKGLGGALVGIRSGYNAEGLAGVPGETLQFDDLNFRFRAPDRPWVSINASALNAEARLAFLRRFPEAYFILIPEEVGDAGFATDQLAEIGAANLKASSSDIRMIKEGPLVVNGLSGWRVEREVVWYGRKVAYTSWYFATNGFAYQLVG